jgi:Domain of unknown function (DUF4340)
MNKRQVITLWSIAIALGAAVTAVKLSQNESTHSAVKRNRGQTLFESFPAAETATIDISGVGNFVTLTKKDGKWTVTQRDAYPANGIYVNEFIRSLSDLKVTLGMEAGPSFAPRFGMDEAATKPEDRGFTAVFKDSSGKEIAKVSLGKSIENSASSTAMGGSSAVGRYVRNHADSSAFYAVSEMFPSISAEPTRWLADAFINPEKIKSIAASDTAKNEPLWKLSRESEEAEFKLEAAAATEVADTTATSAFKSLLSYARFEDVIPNDQIANLAAEGKRTATLETFEGFHYTLTCTPTKPGSLPSSPSPTGQPPTDNFLLTIDVTATLPTERKKAADEKPEDAKTKDTAFADRLKTLNEKLTQEKALAGRTFSVAKSAIEPLMRTRTTLTTQAKPADAGGAAVQGMPGGMIVPSTEAATPAIPIPTPTPNGK